MCEMTFSRAAVFDVVVYDVRSSCSLVLLHIDAKHVGLSDGCLLAC